MAAYHWSQRLSHGYQYWRIIIGFGVGRHGRDKPLFCKWRNGLGKRYIRDMILRTAQSCSLALVLLYFPVSPLLA